MLTIVEKIYNLSKKSPDNIAVIEDENQTSYIDLWNNIKRAANYLQEKFDIDQNSNVIIFEEKSLNFISTYFAVQLLKAIVIPLEKNINNDRLNFIKSSLKVDAIINSYEDLSLKKIILEKQNFN